MSKIFKTGTRITCGIDVAHGFYEFQPNPTTDFDYFDFETLPVYIFHPPVNHRMLCGSFFWPFPFHPPFFGSSLPNIASAFQPK